MADVKILVCGGRDFRDAACVFRVLDRIDARRRIGVVVHGAADGADKLGAGWAKARRRAIRSYVADWSRYGRRAGPVRNATMLAKETDVALVVAFPGGAGTADMVSRARKAGVPVLEVRPTPA